MVSNNSYLNKQKSVYPIANNTNLTSMGQQLHKDAQSVKINAKLVIQELLVNLVKVAIYS